MFYVYALVDPITSGPFYIGKGHGKRCQQHLKESYDRSDNKRKWHRIDLIRSQGSEPLIEILMQTESEHEALAREKALIAHWGRIGFEEGGILTNLTKGGDGVSGYKHTEDTKQLASRPKGKPSEETKQKISASTKGRTFNANSRRKMSESAKNAWKNGREVSPNSIAAIVGRKKTEEEKAKIRSKLKGRVVPDDERQRMLANKPEMTAEIRSKISATKKGKPWSEARRRAQEEKKNGSTPRR
jgi:hypothetical protein